MLDSSSLRGTIRAGQQTCRLRISPQADALLADTHDELPIDADHGGPVRLVVPLLYAWKSAKWLKKITFVPEDAPGYWEQLGYHLRGDPWVVNEDHTDGERFRDDVEGSFDRPEPDDVV